MVPKKKIVFTAIIAVGLLIYAAFGIANYFKGSDDRRLQDLGDELMEEVNAFRAREHRLPADLRELGLEEGSEGSVLYKGEAFYYTVWSDSVFSVEYPLDMERNMVRVSNQPEWEVSYVVFLRK